jgi:protein-S-isoprenylcysteine O-methyltransferase Ste14
MKTIKPYIKTILPSIVNFLALFISAGRLNYWQGWLYFSIIFCMLLISFMPKMTSIELINERVDLNKADKIWDKLYIILSLSSNFVMAIIAGLDSGRYQWSKQFPRSISCIGFVLIIIGEIIFHTAKSQNSFFSRVVRIQAERGHSVYETGLYKVIRHPGYFGLILSTIGFPLLMGSLWSSIPSFISIILLLSRTYLEDKTLKEELDGYESYSRKTRYRLIPFIW